MDPKKRQDLLDHGFTEADIAEYEKSQPQAEAQAQPEGPVEAPSVPFDPTSINGAVAPPNTPEQNAGEALMAGSHLMNSPVGDLAKYGLEAYGAKKLAVDPILNAIKQGRAPAAAAPAPGIQVPPNAGGGPRPNMPAGNPQQMWNTLKTPPPPAPPVGGVAAEQGSSFINRLAQQYGGMASKVAPVLSGASKMIAPAMIAKELFYTSPEERAILQQAEAEKRAKGWKPVNER